MSELLDPRTVIEGEIVEPAAYWEIRLRAGQNVLSLHVLPITCDNLTYHFPVGGIVFPANNLIIGGYTFTTSIARLDDLPR